MPALTLPQLLMIVERMLLINGLLRLWIIAFINLADGFESLLFVAELKAKLDCFLTENKKVQQYNQDLERNLKSVNASPPARRLELVSVVRHPDGHEQQRHTEKLHQNIGRRSESLVEQSDGNGVLEHARGRAQKHAARETEEESAEAHKLETHLQRHDRADESEDVEYYYGLLGAEGLHVVAAEK